MKAAWIANREAIQARRDEFTFKMPVELLVPTDPEDEETVKHISTCAYRYLCSTK